MKNPDLQREYYVMLLSLARLQDGPNCPIDVLLAQVGRAKREAEEDMKRDAPLPDSQAGKILAAWKAMGDKPDAKTVAQQAGAPIGNVYTTVAFWRKQGMDLAETEKGKVVRLNREKALAAEQKWQEKLEPKPSTAPAPVAAPEVKLRESFVVSLDIRNQLVARLVNKCRQLSPNDTPTLQTLGELRECAEILALITP